MLILLGLTGCDENVPTLEIESVQPSQASTDRWTTLQVNGQFYAPIGADLSSGSLFLLDEFEVRLGDTPLGEVVLFSQNRITAVVPRGFEEGIHNLSIYDPLGREAILDDAVQVIPLDDTRPIVEIRDLESGEHVSAGSSFTLIYSVIDESPGGVKYIEWAMGGATNRQGELLFDTPMNEYTGEIEVTLPREPTTQVVVILITAEDSALIPNRGSARLDLVVDVCSADEDCDDELRCNGIESCLDGSCVQGESLHCDDGLNCTQDLCDEVMGDCYHVVTHELCNDGFFCNGEERCDLYLGCVSGEPPCDDEIDCTEDECRESAALGEPGECTNIASDRLCQDGEFCNGQEHCILGRGCVDGVNPCTDEFECTVETCIEEWRYCEVVLDHDACQNFDPCTEERCVKDEGCVSSAVIEGTDAPGTCGDGVDNDCDDFTDNEDPDCLED